VYTHGGTFFKSLVLPLRAERSHTQGVRGGGIRGGGGALYGNGGDVSREQQSGVPSETEESSGEVERRPPHLSPSLAVVLFSFSWQNSTALAGLHTMSVLYECLLIITNLQSRFLSILGSTVLYIANDI
jgi:hypothetical protein